MEKTRLPLNKAIDKACCDDPLLADRIWKFLKNSKGLAQTRMGLQEEVCKYLILFMLIEYSYLAVIAIDDPFTIHGRLKDGRRGHLCKRYF